jgi:hypothetical protein
MKRSVILSVVAVLAVALSAAAASAQAPSPRVLPADVQRGWYADQRIFIEVMPANVAVPFTGSADGSTANSTYPHSEHFGNRLGDIIAMRVRIYSMEPLAANQRPVQFDFSALKAGRLTIEPDPEKDPDWELADPLALAPGDKPISLPETPLKVLLRTADGKEHQAELYDILLFVQTKRQPVPMNFWLEFAYAAQVTPNGNLDWQRLSTPDFLVSASRTADAGRDLRMGNSNAVEQKRPLTLAVIALSFGSLLLLLPPAAMTIRALRKRFRYHRQDDPAETAWAVFAPIQTATRTADGGYALTYEQVAAVVKALKDFAGITCGVKQLQERRFEYDDGEELVAVLYPLEHGVLEEGAALSPKRYGELFERIEKLCPKP